MKSIGIVLLAGLAFLNPVSAEEFYIQGDKITPFAQSTNVDADSLRRNGQIAEADLIGRYIAQYGHPCIAVNHEIVPVWVAERCWEMVPSLGKQFGSQGGSD